jgi:hypothetical protein
MKQSYTFQKELSSHDINKFNIILIICSIAYDCCGIRNMLMHISEKKSQGCTNREMQIMFRKRKQNKTYEIIWPLIYNISC